MLRTFLFSLVILSFLVVSFGCAPDQAVMKADPKLDNPKSRISYTIGVNIGRDFASKEMEIDPDVLLVGLTDAMDGKELRMTDEEMVAEVQAYQQRMQEEQVAKQAALAEKNKAEGEAFLAENAEKEGVVTLPSGLQYKIIEPGDGSSPLPNSVVTVHYSGTLIDGTEFDSSYARNQPAVFPVGGVIPGWSQALPLMKVGSKWQLFIPSHLAYGENGAGRDIGPNATLIFEVELISIQSQSE